MVLEIRGPFPVLGQDEMVLALRVSVETAGETSTCLPGRTHPGQKGLEEFFALRGAGRHFQSEQEHGYTPCRVTDEGELRLVMLLPSEAKGESAKAKGMDQVLKSNPFLVRIASQWLCQDPGGSRCRHNLLFSWLSLAVFPLGR